MKPVCCGLDVLQGETAVGLGFLLPTLSVMKSQLSSLLDANNVNDRLTVCEPLASCLVNAINGRFEGMFTNPDAQLAAVVHPKFKFDWIDNVYERSQLTDILKRRVSSLASSPTSEDGQSSSVTAVRTETSIQLQPVDFFAGLSARRQRNAGPLDVNQEVDKYLADSSDTLTSLDSYPHVRQLFIVLNTGLPSSAAVERLFSLGGRVFSPLRSRLTSAHFEMLTFLRLAKW